MVIVEIIIGIILVSLIVGNNVAVYRSKKRRSKICWLHNRKVTLGFDSQRADLSNDLFVDKSILKMHNKGTDLKKEIDNLNFIPIANECDYFGKFGL